MSALFARSPRRRAPLITAALLGIALAATACTSSPAEPAEDGASIVVVSPSADFSWAFDNALGVMEPLMNVHATLVRKPYVEAASGALQQDLYEFEPYLAESYDVSPDGLTYTFQLRDGVKSDAGNELSADDVIWSFERKFNTPTSVVPGAFSTSLTDPASQIKKIDDSTVTFSVPTASAGTTLLAVLADIGGQIYDSTLLKEHATSDDPYAVKWSANNPNYGFGAYTVDSYEQGSQAVLAARDDFFLGAPAVKRIVFKAISDAGQRSNAIADGSAAIAEGILPADQATLASNDAVAVPEVDNPNTTLMLPLVANKAPFDDVTVRQAFAYAIPYQQIIDDVYKGRAVRENQGLLDPTLPNFDDAGYPDYDTDPAKAKELLAEAGYPDGVSFTLTVDTANPDAVQAAQIIKSAAADSGFEIEIEQLPDGTFTERKASHALQAYLTIDYAVTMLPSYILRAFTQADSSNNLADWTSSAFEDELAAGLAAGDQLSEAAVAHWNAAEKIMLDETPIVKLANMQPSVALRSDLDGYAWRSDNWIDYSNLAPAE
jgi:peptide/nickel transport system substrate-binding protein